MESVKAAAIVCPRVLLNLPWGNLTGYFSSRRPRASQVNSAGYFGIHLPGRVCMKGCSWGGMDDEEGLAKKGYRNMQLRKLENNEHGLTRSLWEQVFSEDSREFLDYYYFIKTRDNQIYVIEEDGTIRSMLQLNPYLLRTGEQEYLAEYIIAVATEEGYRRRGYMGLLLNRAMTDMYAQKQPFTFLMPAAEAIYTPYDFRFIYAQNQEESQGERGEPQIEVTEAAMRDAGSMAEFFNRHFKDKYQVCAVRDEKYYQTMILEQQSENGGVRLLKRDGQIVGMFAYAQEESVEIREPLYLQEYEGDFEKIIRKLKEESAGTVKIFAGKDSHDSRKVPVIMARILHLETMFSLLKTKEGKDIDCSFAVLDSIITKNSKVWRLQSFEDNRQIQVRETEDSEGVLTIGALASLLFGYKAVEEIKNEENVVISDRLEEELGKIETLNRVFLNEIV